jgi:hypothetical protein
MNVQIHGLLVLALTLQQPGWECAQAFLVKGLAKIPLQNLELDQPLAAQSNQLSPKTRPTIFRMSAF